MSSLIIYTIPSGQLWNHGHMSNTKQTQKALFVYLCIHMLVIRTKRPSIWEGSKGGGRGHGRYWKEEKENMISYILIKIRKEACLWARATFLFLLLPLLARLWCIEIPLCGSSYFIYPVSSCQGSSPTVQQLLCHLPRHPSACPCGHDRYYVSI